jgi:hypothetical protein
MSAVRATFSRVGAALLMGITVPLCWVAVCTASALASMACEHSMTQHSTWGQHMVSGGLDKKLARYINQSVQGCFIVLHLSVPCMGMLLASLVCWRVSKQMAITAS